MQITSVDHVELYAADADGLAADLAAGFDLTVLGRVTDHAGSTVLLGHGGVRLLVTSGPTADGHVRRHGDGVARVGIGTPDAAGAYREAVAAGARPLAAPRVWSVGDDVVVTATVAGFGDVAHRFVERRAGTSFWPGLLADAAPVGGRLLDAVDHLAICVPTEELDGTIRTYERVFGFERTFTERIEVGGQAMYSVVVQSPSRGVTLTVIAPGPASRAGQIDDFLRAHDGAGVQHVAFRTSDIVGAVDAFAANGIGFLGTPSSYYDDVRRRLGSTDLPVGRLQERSILVDRDHHGEMLQIFTEAQVSRRTLFFELIERHGALTFGSNNIKALYEAKERERTETTVHT